VLPFLGAFSPSVWGIETSDKYDKYDKYDKIDSEVIYDTIIKYCDDNCKVLNVFQTSRTSYLIKFEDNNDAKYICNLLNNTLIDKNMINVDYFGNDNLYNNGNTTNIPISDVNVMHKSNNKISELAIDIDRFSYKNWLLSKLNNIIIFLLPSAIKNKLSRN
jgi:hypothetical protein